MITPRRKPGSKKKALTVPGNTVKAFCQQIYKSHLYCTMLAGKRQAKIRENAPESGLVWGINILTIPEKYSGMKAGLSTGEYKGVVQAGREDPPAGLVRIPLPLVQGKAGRKCFIGKRKWTAGITEKWT